MFNDNELTINMFYLLQNVTEQLAVLRGHTGLVKGVTWDPVGKYLASQVSLTIPKKLDLNKIYLLYQI